MLNRRDAAAPPTRAEPHTGGRCGCRSNKAEVWEGGDSRRKAGPGLAGNGVCADVIRPSLRVHQGVRSHTHATIHHYGEREVPPGGAAGPAGLGEARPASDRPPPSGPPCWSLEPENKRSGGDGNGQ